MTGSEITKVAGRQVWDSRGRPTIEAEVQLKDGSVGRAIAPAGASRGRHEAVDLRDGGPAFDGLGVQTALGRLDEIITPTLVGMDALDQEAIDGLLNQLDGTHNKAHLGGNTTIAVSMAALHAGARSSGRPLYEHLHGAVPNQMPMPEIQILGGGAHAGRRVDIQDFMIVCPGAKTFGDALSMTAAVYAKAGALLESRGQRYGVADEGGYWPAFDRNEHALAFVTEAIEAAGFVPGKDVGMALDIAALEFYDDGHYHLALDGEAFSTDAFIGKVINWIERFPILSVEDPVAEDDHDGMRQFTAAVGDKVRIVADDYVVTNAQRIAAAASAGACNAALIKPNQAGTVTETYAAVCTAQQAGWGTVVSARSGETEDTTIVHLAVGWGADQLKVGSFSRSERMAKWNEGIRIEEELRATHNTWPLLAAVSWGGEVRCASSSTMPRAVVSASDLPGLKKAV